MLEIRHITKFFGDLAALKDISFQIAAGDSVLLYGPNGAGKTTLLRVLATLARPSSGQIFFRDRVIEKNLAEAKAAIGFVSHATFLYGELTVRENLHFFGKLFRLEELDKKVDSALELFNLRERGSVMVRELSRGLQQRASLARAFLHDPAVVLLDEPFTGLDSASIRNLEEVLKRLPEQGKSLLFSSHDFEQGASIARRLLALGSGRALYDGPLASAPFEALRIRRAEQN